METNTNIPDKLLKPYNPQETEPEILQAWDDSGLANPDVCIERGYTAPDAETFSVVLPPPNVTGTLHTGHALMLIIQDIMVRYARMSGKRTLWVPGTDHAAIATQSKVEKIIEKEGLKKRDMGRDEFLKRVEQFAQESHDTIVNQCKTMGASLDWSREAFTLDEQRTTAVYTAFKQMYDDQLIYRGHRIVNWDTKGQTTISDDEIVYKEETTKFYYFKYGPFTIGTARPETKFGDKYVVMHPDDVRYAQYNHGDKLTVEWINGPIETTIIKDEIIDMEFGTGVMTITPWHSKEDFNIAEKYKLDKEQIIDQYGKLLPIAREFSGMKILEAREKIVEKLASKGLVEKIEENYKHNIATAERSGGIIEPQIMNQWFIDVNKPILVRGNKSLKQLMLDAVRSKEVEILPERFEKNYFHWIENLQDWCISRQIWYGHRIPVWYDLRNPKNKSIIFYFEAGLDLKGLSLLEDFFGNKEDKLNSIARSTNTEGILELIDKNYFTWDQIKSKITGYQEYQGLCEPILSEELIKNKEVIFQDLDTLDTWFSSGLWTFSTLGWPYHKEIKFNENLIDKIKNNTKNSTFRLEKKDFATGDIVKFKNKQTGELFGYGTIISTNEIVMPDIEHLDALRKYYPNENITMESLVWKYDFTFNEQSPLELYHPTTVMETGHDILFFWIARMVLMSEYLLGVVPFKTVYLHGLVRDAQGRKMSKSLGNATDPLDLIAKYGNDALRMAMIIGNTPGNDLKLNENDIRGYGKFANKIWNATRFVLEKISDLDISAQSVLNEPDQQSVTELTETIATVTREMNEYKFSLAGEKLYHLFWHTFADVIIERSKSTLMDDTASSTDKLSAQWVLYIYLTTLLRALHPFMPFVTEELWKHVGTVLSKTKDLEKEHKLLIIETWPE